MSDRAGVTDFGPDRRSSFDRLRMSGYLFPLMVSLSNHGRDHVRVHPDRALGLTLFVGNVTIAPTCPEAAI
jgi:hypothetical protein